MRLHSIIFIFLFSSLLNACQEKQTTTNLQITHDGILFVGADSGFLASTLFYLDTETLLTQRVLSAQSGDFVLLSDKNEIYGINRKADNLNFREISIDMDKNLNFSEQLPFPGLSTGDPHDIAKIDNELILFLNFNSNSIDLVNSNDSSLIQSIGSELDIPGGLPFHPERIIKFGDDRFFILHQGFAKDFLSTSNGAIYELSWKDDILKFVDKNPKKIGIQGIKLKSHTPIEFFKSSDSEITIFGLCTNWYESCVQAIERLDLNNSELKEIDFPLLTEINAFAGIEMVNQHEYYGIIRRTNNNESTVSLSQIDLDLNQIKDIHTFKDINKDGYEDTGLFILDKEADTIFLGIPENEISGTIKKFENNIETQSIPIDSIPLQGIRVKYDHP